MLCCGISNYCPCFRFSDTHFNDADEGILVSYRCAPWTNLAYRPPIPITCLMNEAPSECRTSRTLFWPVHGAQHFPRGFCRICTLHLATTAIRRLWSRSRWTYVSRPRVSDPTLRFLALAFSSLFLHGHNDKAAMVAPRSRWTCGYIRPTFIVSLFPKTPTRNGPLPSCPRSSPPHSPVCVCCPGHRQLARLALHHEPRRGARSQLR